MSIDDLKNELIRINHFIYFDDNEYLREKCSDELVLKEIIEKFEEEIHSLSNSKSEDMIFLHGNIGNLYRILGNTQQAIDSLQTAVGLCDENKKISNVIRLGEALKYDGQPEQALNKFDEAIDLCTSSVSSVLLDFAYQHKGKCLLELGQMNLALDYFQKAMKIRIAKGDQSLIASTQKVIDFIEC